MVMILEATILITRSSEINNLGFDKSPCRRRIRQGEAGHLWTDTGEHGLKRGQTEFSI